MRPRHVTLSILIALLPACAQCPDPFKAPSSPVDNLHFPTAVAVHPSQDALFVVNSNGDLAYSSGAVMGMRLDWLYQRLETESSVGTVDAPFTAAALTPSLGASLVPSSDGKFLFTLGRQDNLLVALEVEASEGDLRIHCGDRVTALQDCTTGDHVVQVGTDDPYGLAVRPSGVGQWQVFAAALRNGNLYSATLDPGHGSGPLFQVDWVMSLGPNDRGGSLALLPAVDGFPEYLLGSGRQIPGNDPPQGSLRFLSLDDGPQGVAGLVDLRNQAGAVDPRGVAVSARRQRAYTVVKVPEGLVELDMTREPGGVPSCRVMRVAQLGKEPSAIALYEPEKGLGLILTASFRDNVLLALDMDTLDVFGVVRNVGLNPFEIAVDNRRGYAFVSNFNEDTVSVIRLPRVNQADGSLDLRFELAGKLGTPRDTQQTNPNVPTSLTDLPALPRGLPSF